MRLVLLSLLLIPFSFFGQTRFKKSLLIDFTSSYSLESSTSTILPDGSHVVLSRLDSMNLPTSYSQITKVDYQGSTLWSKGLFSGAGLLPVGIVTTQDGGGIVVTNVIDTLLFETDIIVSKFNTNGLLQWQSSYCAPEDQFARDIIGTLDGGFLIAGTARNLSNDFDHVVVKINSTGAIVWVKTLINVAAQSNGKVKELPNGDIVLAGESGANVVVYKITSSGNLIWASQLSSQYALFLADFNMYSSDLIITGLTYNSNSPGYIARISANGSFVWAKEMGNFNQSCVPHAMVKTLDQKFIITGFQFDTIVWGFCPFLKKFDSFGNEDWHVFHGFGSGSRLEGFDIVSNPDTTYFISCRQMGMIFQTDQFGTSGCMEIYSPVPLQPVIYTSTTYPVTIGTMSFQNLSSLSITPPNLQEYWYCSNGISTATATATFSIYPNPASDFISLQLTTATATFLRVTNLLGQVLLEIPNYQSGDQINISTLPSGLYSVRVGEAQAKFILVR